MSAEDKIGRAVLLPVKLALVVISIPLVVAAYPFVGIWVFVRAPGTLKERAQAAAYWPLLLLALNDFLSLGGQDSSLLTRISDRLNRRGKKRPGKK